MNHSTLQLLERAPKVIGVVLIALGISASCLAATENNAPPIAPAASEPATSRHSVDRSTVRGALRALWEAIAGGNVGRVADSLEASGPASREFTAAVARFLVAGNQLSDATSARFGKTGRPVGEPMLDFRHLDQAIGKLKINESGDTATAIGENNSQMQFHKSDGQWRLVVSDFANGKAADRPAQIKLLNDLASAIEDATREIESGRVQTPQEAQRIIQDRLHAVMIQRFHPTSFPATRPAARP